MGDTALIVALHHMRTGGRSRSVELKVGGSVQRRAEYHIVTAHVVQLTVIDGSVALSRNGHRRLNRVDRQVAVISHHKVHLCEVRGVGIGELAGSEMHVDCTGIRECQRTVASEGEVSAGVQRIAEGHIVTTHRMLRCVVVHHIVMTGERNRNINRDDGHVTVCHVKGHLCEVRVRVGELTLGKTHCRGTAVRTCSNAVTAEGEAGVHIVECRSSRSHITLRRVRIAVVRHRRICTHNGHRCIDRGDGLITVDHVKGHLCEVRVRVGELILGKTHVGGTGVRA